MALSYRNLKQIMKESLGIGKNTLRHAVSLRLHSSILMTGVAHFIAGHSAVE